MKTADLVVMLAHGAGAVDHHTAARRSAIAIGLGVLAAALLMSTLLKVRGDIATAALLPMFWVKLAYAASLAIAGMLAAFRLSHPGARLAGVAGVLAAIIIAMWAYALLTLAPTTPPERERLFFGDTWRSCPLLIAMLSVPVLVGVITAMNGFAPTRLRAAGAAAGFASGALGALVYSVHCPEMGAPFIGVWYLLGMLLPTLAGACLGPRLLRW